MDKASFKTISISGSVAARVTNEVARMANEATNIPRRVAGAVDEVVEVEAGCDTVVAVDLAIIMVYEAPSKASDSHSMNVKEAAKPLTKRGKASRRYRPKVMEVRRSTTFGIKIPYEKTCQSMLEKYIPPKYKGKLL